MKYFKIFCLLSLFMIITVSCKNICSECKSCSINKILMSPDDLPGDQWEEIGSRSYRDAPKKVGIDRIGTSFSTPTSGIVVEDIYQFKNADETLNGYYKLSDYWFNLEPEGTTWTQLILPENIDIRPGEYRLECSVRQNNTIRTCWYSASYNNNVILFKATMISISDQDFFQLIKLIDQKADDCVATK